MNLQILGYHFKLLINSGAFVCVCVCERQTYRQIAKSIPQVNVTVQTIRFARL